METGVSKKRLRLLVFVAGGFLLVTVLMLVYPREKTVSTGAQFFTSPMDAIVRIDGVEIKPNRNGIAELAPGIYSAEIDRQHFEPQIQEFSVSEGEVTEVLTMLIPEKHGQEGEALLGRPNEQENRESIAYRLSLRRSQEVTNKNPITALLPVFNNEFRIDYGAPDDDGEITIFITTDIVSQRSLALEWIKSRGFNPEDLKINYRFFDDL